jgi:hypothetical protein
MGAWMEMPHLGAWFILLLAAAIGVWMKRAGWPRPPLLLGFVLGPIMESGFRLSTSAFGDFGWMTRPFVILFAVVIVATLVWKLVTERSRRGPSKSDGPSVGEGYAGDPLFSAAFAVLALICFAGAAWMALDWRPSARQFPLTIALPTIVFLSVLLWREARIAAARAEAAGGLRHSIVASGHAALIGKTGIFFAALIGIILAATLIGQPFALTAFTAGYLVWAGAGIPTAAIYGASTLAFLLGFYGALLNTSWLLPLFDLFG